MGLPSASRTFPWVSRVPPEHSRGSPECLQNIPVGLPSAFRTFPCVSQVPSEHSRGSPECPQNIPVCLPTSAFRTFPWVSRVSPPPKKKKNSRVSSECPYNCVKHSTSFLKHTKSCFLKTKSITFISYLT